VPRSRKLQARRQRARLHDEHRAWIEAEFEAGATAEELDLYYFRAPPAIEFICERLKGVAPENLDDEFLIDVIEELLVSDILDPTDQQQFIKQRDALRQMGKRERAAHKRRAQELLLADLTEYLKERGDFAPKKRALKALGLKADTIKKRRQRSRNKKA